LKYYLDDRYVFGNSLLYHIKKIFRTNPRLKTRIDLNLFRGLFFKLRFPERNFLNHQIALSLTELFKSRYNASTCIVSQFQSSYKKNIHNSFVEGILFSLVEKIDINKNSRLSKKSEDHKTFINY